VFVSIQIGDDYWSIRFQILMLENLGATVELGSYRQELMMPNEACR
jgi:hypothetical protein